MNKFRLLTLALILAGMLSLPVGALEYNVSGVPQYDFYQSTDYEDIYGAKYQYGGDNPTDFNWDGLAYGLSTQTSIGVFDTITPNLGASAYTASQGNTSDLTFSYESPVSFTQFTSSESIVRSDGTLGTLSIPSLGITAPIYTGTSDSALAQGFGHFDSTSAWNGNVGIAGHNRGSTYVLGDIKELEEGDLIYYTTDLGTRCYTVTTVAQISNSNWSYLTATTDNRITLVTCVENNSDLRWVVQAVCSSS